MSFLKTNRRNSVWYLAEEADIEAECLSISGARVHVIPDQQHQLQEHAKAFALLHLLACECHVHDVGPDVVHLLLKCQFEQDPIKSGTQQLD